MKAEIGDWNTTWHLENDEAATICKLGQGAECCAFLVRDSKGFQCVRMDYPTNADIIAKLKEGTMNAKGEGMGPGCPWGESKEINHENTM